MCHVNALVEKGVYRELCEHKRGTLKSEQRDKYQAF